jgi:hypothetical protein
MQSPPAWRKRTWGVNDTATREHGQRSATLPRLAKLGHVTASHSHYVIYRPFQAVVKVFKGAEVYVLALGIVLLWASNSVSCLGIRGSNLDRWPDIRWFQMMMMMMTLQLLFILCSFGFRPRVFQHVDIPNFEGKRCLLLQGRID